jgi:two-component system copper resistance phosphate regulon response regulator CusR
MKILLIEDEPNVVAFIKQGLEEQTFIVEVAYDGQLGKRLALYNKYNLIIIDVILPYINGLELCKEIRKKDTNVPILLLSALGTTDDVVRGLDNGADDYLTKPFKFQELLARIRALTRRRSAQGLKNGLVHTIANLELNTSSKIVTRDNQIIKLTPREYFLLYYLMRNQDILLSRSDIAENVWEDAFEAGSNIVDVYINYLRNKIDKNFQPKLIHTIVGMGYMLREGTE